jgi:anti-sigma factor RsiW
MDCKKIQELIMTDYIDAEASEPLRKEIETHLKTCEGCREFEQALRERVSNPFRKLEETKPPEEIWQRIKETIEDEQAEQYAPPLLERLLDFLRNSFTARRPVFAFSTAISVIVVALFFLAGPFHKQQLVKDYIEEQAEFMVSLNRPVNGDLDQDFSFGTAIERYLF